MCNHEEKIAEIISNHFKIVGCGNCLTNEKLHKQSEMFRGCFNRTSSGSYWSVSKAHAHSTSQEIISYLHDEGVL